MRIYAPALPLLVVLLGACAQTYYGTPEEWALSDQAGLRAEGVAEVVLDYRQGPLRIEAGGGDSIRVHLRVGPARGAGGTTRACPPEEVKVTSRRQGSGLRLDTDPSLPDGCVSGWRIVLPPGTSVRARVHAGHVTVRGLSGGVDLTSATGDLTLHLTGGPVTATTGTGDIELTYASDEYGEVSARTGVGDVELVLNDREVHTPRPPGAGDRVTLEDGDGPALRLRVNVGHIRLRLGTHR